MPNSPLPENMTKVSYILEKKAKKKLEQAAKKTGCSMSALITKALAVAGVLPSVQPR
jgi:hypothetical protein